MSYHSEKGIRKFRIFKFYVEVLHSDGYRRIQNVENINKNLSVILRRVISGDAYSRAFIFVH